MQILLSLQFNGNKSPHSKNTIDVSEKVQLCHNFNDLFLLVAIISVKENVKNETIRKELRFNCDKYMPRDQSKLTAQCDV